MGIIGEKGGNVHGNKKPPKNYNSWETREAEGVDAPRLDTQTHRKGEEENVASFVRPPGGDATDKNNTNTNKIKEIPKYIATKNRLATHQNETSLRLLFHTNIRYTRTKEKKDNNQLRINERKTNKNQNATRHAKKPQEVFQRQEG